MPTPSIKDDTIIQAVKARFAAIVTTAGNYFYNYPKVYDVIAGRSAIPENVTRAINIRDVSDEFLQESSESSDSLHDIRLNLEIDILVRNHSASDLRKIKADLLKSIGTDLKWGGLAFNTVYLNSQRNRRDAYGEVISDLTISIEIYYRKTAWSVS